MKTKKSHTLFYFHSLLEQDIENNLSYVCCCLYLTTNSPNKPNCCFCHKSQKNGDTVVLITAWPFCSMFLLYTLNCGYARLQVSSSFQL